MALLPACLPPQFEPTAPVRAHSVRIECRPGDWVIVLRRMGIDSGQPRSLALALKRLLRFDGVKCVEAREIAGGRS